MPSLLDKRLIFVTGKGGVGKSTVSAALGVAAAKRGKRTIICEVAQQERMSRYFHRKGSHFDEVELAENLFAISIDPEKAIEQYLRLQIKVKPIADLLFSNRIFHYFVAATPGMKEQVTIGKAWEVAQLDRWVKKAPKYDLAILDAPATGHGIGLMRTPKTFADIARVGPIKRQSERVHNFITDPGKTGVIAVAWPEEMPVSETLDLKARLKDEMGMKLDLIVMNGLYPARFGKTESEQLKERYATAENGSPEKMVVRAALRAALSESTRARAQAQQLQRLKKESGFDPVKLPFLFEAEFDAKHFETLAKPIEAVL